ncbi:MAG: hypothetical protein QOJ62_3021, partial [Actinomycetota bacterium]|nr:hypothetical protein [Actinomycetota bacterium]
PQACTTTSPPGGVQCNTGTLRPGQKVSFSFTLIPALLGVDQIYGQVYWANKMGQPQTGLFNEQVTVVDGTTPSPPSSVSPSPTGTTSPSARSTSTAPGGAPPTS